MASEQAAETVSGTTPEDELMAGTPSNPASERVTSLFEHVLKKENLRQALRQVRRNRGAPGIDGMSVDELPGYLKDHWLGIKDALQNERYRPQPVKRVEIPKPDGRKRKLGIPTVLDRFIQQAINQVLQCVFDPTFHPHSYGFRPKRSAHQAVRHAQEQVKAGWSWVVDLDLEAFFDRVNHDRLMHRLKQRIDDPALLRLIGRFLRAGVQIGETVEPTQEGVPQGGPLSPLLANVVLDELDQELTRRGHRFARYADDCNVFVRSKSAGTRVMQSLRRYLERTLRLGVNEAKSAVDRPWKRTFLGFTLSRKDKTLKVADKAIDALKDKVRAISVRTRGHRLTQIIEELRELLLGWKAYFGITEVQSPLRDLDRWVRRRLRCYLWKQWDRSGYRQLRKRGVSRELAWNTAKSAHGPWRLSRSPALAIALPNRYFTGLGLPTLETR
ncbi:MAG: group II intron reverse transcriptase/maturase [Gammaproteobacteria bacterium]|nr:group II intron reverse transcriptase/maturase [Gammaproteobacteria bacterium]